MQIGILQYNTVAFPMARSGLSTEIALEFICLRAENDSRLRGLLATSYALPLSYLARQLAFQASCREFESRLPLKTKKEVIQLPFFVSRSDVHLFWQNATDVSSTKAF